MRQLAMGLLALGVASFTPALAREPELSSDAINKAEVSGKGASKSKAALIKAEVLLDRTRFSPGLIDGSDGDNVKKAISAFQQRNGLKPSGRLDQDTWNKLKEASQDPVLTNYTITDEDVKGPFSENIPAKMEEQADLDRLGYTSPIELLAEKFHMSEALLKTLNKGKNLDQAGTVITVANVADVGEQRKAKEKFTIKPGPNNPVGLVWIALTGEGYGIHGTPEPDKVGKTASHGCVRLTNWDAMELASMVDKGTPVEFRN